MQCVRGCNCYNFKTWAKTSWSKHWRLESPNCKGIVAISQFAVKWCDLNLHLICSDCIHLRWHSQQNVAIGTNLIVETPTMLHFESFHYLVASLLRLVSLSSWPDRRQRAVPALIIHTENSTRSDNEASYTYSKNNLIYIETFLFPSIKFEILLKHVFWIWS